MESVGFCLMYPLKPAVLAPTFVGAYSGNDENLPTWQHVYADARATESLELMVRLLRERTAYETNLFGKTNFLVSAAVFPFFYALMGDRNPRRTVRENSVTGHGKLSALAQDVYRAVQEHGPITTRKFGGLVGVELSDAALDRALNELWASLMITRVDYNAADGASWDVLYRWSPEAVKEGGQLSVAEAVSALVSKYLDCVVAAEPREVEDFFAPMVARSRVSEAIKALLTTRDFSFSHTGERSLVCMTPAATGPGKFPRMPRKVSSPRSRSAEAEVRANEQPNSASSKSAEDGITAAASPEQAEVKTTRRPTGPQENSIFKRKLPPAAAATSSVPAARTRSAGPRDSRPGRPRPGGGTRPFSKSGAGGSRPAFSRRPSDSAKLAGARRSSFRDAKSQGPPSRDPSFRGANSGETPLDVSGPAYSAPEVSSSVERKVPEENRRYTPPASDPMTDMSSAITSPVDVGSSIAEPASTPAFFPAQAGATSPASSYVKKPFAEPASSKPGFSKPGLAKPGFSKSGFAGKGFAKRGFSKPGVGKPRPSRTEGGSSHPAGKFGKSRFGKPGESRPEGRPGADGGWSASARSGPRRSAEGTESKFRGSSPRFARSGSDRPRPDRKRPDRPEGASSGRPSSDRPKFDRPIFEQTKSGRAGADRPRPDRPRPDRPRSERPNSDRPRPARSDSTKSAQPESRYGGMSRGPGPGGAKPGRTGFGGARSGGKFAPGRRSKPGESKFGGKSSFGKPRTSKDGNYLPRRDPRKASGSAPFARGTKIRGLKEKPPSEPEA